MRNSSHGSSVKVWPVVRRRWSVPISNGVPWTTHASGPLATRVGPARQISSAAASGGLPTSPFPSMSDRRSAGAAHRNAEATETRTAEIDDEGAKAGGEDY